MKKVAPILWICIVLCLTYIPILLLAVYSFTDATTVGADIGGFTFANYDVWDMLGALNRALESFYDYPASWRSLMTRGMRAHFTWDKSARQYMDLYRSL